MKEQIVCKHCGTELKNDTSLIRINHMYLVHPDILFKEVELPLKTILDSNFETKKRE